MYLRDAINEKVERDFIDNLHADFCKHHATFDRIVFLLVEVTRILINDPFTSLSGIIQLLFENSILVRRNDLSEIDERTRRCIFAAVGWITMLYKPCTAEQYGPLAVESHGAPCLSVSKVDVFLTRRPIVEMLRNMGGGEILPLNSWDPADNPKILHVASMNIATLEKVGTIKLHWTDVFSAHLDFDPATSTLRLFRLPSICQLHGTDHSVLSR